MFQTNSIYSLALSTVDVSSIGPSQAKYDLAAPAPLPQPAAQHLFTSPHVTQVLYSVAVTSRQKILTLSQNTVQISDFTVENARYRLPALLQTPQKQPDMISDVFDAFYQNSSLQMVVQALARLRLQQTPPGDFGIYQELGCMTEPSEVNTEVYVFRAVCYVVSILFGTHFQSKIELPYLYFEQENAEADYKARYHTLRKWFYHYLFNHATTHTDLTYRVLSFIALGKYTEAAAILSDKRQNRLALIVCAGRIANWKQIFSELNETQIVNAELVLRALAGDLTAYNGYFSSWIELFAAALQKTETVEMACAEYAKIAGSLEDGSYICQIIQFYGSQRRHRTISATLEQIAAICLHRKIPPLCGLVIGKFFLDQLKNSSVFVTAISYEQNYEAVRTLVDRLAFRAALELFSNQRDDDAFRLLELFQAFTDSRCKWCYAKICAANRETVDSARAIRYLGQVEWQRIVYGQEYGSAVEEEVIDILEFL